METTIETAALLAELFERSAIVTELDGPQIEAWVSGLFPVLSTDALVVEFVDYCEQAPSVTASLLCEAIAHIADGEVAERAATVASGLVAHRPVVADQIGASTMTQAWRVEAPIGTSIVIGFENGVVVDSDLEEDEAVDSRHAILVELSLDGQIEDLQLAGAPQELLAEAAESGDRVRLIDLPLADATAAIAEAWPTGARDEASLGSGLLSNQAFVRSRLRAFVPQPLPAIEVAKQAVDIRRGLSDADYTNANRATLSTLRAAVGDAPETAQQSALHDAWVEVIQGNAGVMTSRERDGLLWLEWADWLGASIGLLRSGAGAAMTGSALVDYVNRCPEVSSSIEKSDREYAEWAFEIAIELLEDAGVCSTGALTQAGFDSLHGALITAWS